MGNLKVTMTDVNGVSKTFDGVEEGTSLMELGKRNDVAGIMGDCGGGCACATCHVYVDGDWFAKVGERRNYYRGRTGQAFYAHTYRRAI